MSTWITRLAPSGTGPRVAVKDAIDVAGLPTTVGCAAIADSATPAETDAACLRGFRSADAAIVGKANLHELCFGISGINRWYGTAENPIDAFRVPGGSSSGSAVAVANDEADIALGTDTGGSVRIPAACCGVVGLKTTWGRVSLDGVWPLAPSLDTVGPLAPAVAGVVRGMQLLLDDPTFGSDASPATVVGRVRVPDVDPAWDAAVDHALALSGVTVIDVELPGRRSAERAVGRIILREAWESDHATLERAPDRVDERTADRLRLGLGVSDADLNEARAQQEAWRRELASIFDRVSVLALPTLPGDPPRIADVDSARPLNAFSGCFNLAGVPALALPVPSTASPFTSLQLVGPMGGDESVCATAALIEAAVRP